MPHVNPSLPIAKLVLEHHAAARVLERFDLDYCCGGQRSLAEMCDAEGLELGEVVSAIEHEIDRVVPAGTDWGSLPLDELATAIDRAHHDYAREAVSHLTPLVEKVCRVHGAKHPELEEVNRLFGALASELLPHLRKEEVALFPAIRALATDPRDSLASGLEAPLAVMREEHDHVGSILRALRTVTRGYVVPPGGCTSFRVLYAGLAALAADLHEHIHLENHLLFPRVEDEIAVRKQRS